MSVRPVRFLHVGELRLDQPVRTAIPLDDRARQTLAAANGLAWDQIVLEAIDRAVDFVLLNGHSFDAERSGSGTEQRLCGGIEQLLDGGIAVAVRPGSIDPPGAWRELFPARVQWLSNDDNEMNSLHDAQGDVCAQVLPRGTINETMLSQLDDSLPRLSADEAVSGRDLATIELSGKVDYLAWGASAVLQSRGEFRTRHRLHVSGPQPHSRRSSGLSGCLLAEIDSDGQVHAQRLATATVRLLELPLVVNPASTLEDLCLEIQSRQEQLPVEPHERLRLVRWNLTGEGRLLTELLRDDGESLDRAWRSEFAPHDGLQILQEFAIDVGPEHLPRHSPGTLQSELQAIVFDGLLVPCDRWETELDALFGTDAAAISLRDRLVPRVSSEEIARRARNRLVPEISHRYEERTP